jgi:hypothetical protein
MPLISPYIPEEWKEKIRKYKYKGSDNSIFYKLFTGPVCDWLVTFIPSSIVPNIVIESLTLDNFSWIILQYSISIINMFLHRNGGWAGCSLLGMPLV